MEPPALLDLMAELAEQAGLRVRVMPRGGAVEGESLPGTGVCRVRDQIWVVLSPHDPIEERIDAVAAALRDHAGPYLEGRFVPPAVRARIEAL